MVPRITFVPVWDEGFFIFQWKGDLKLKLKSLDENIILKEASMDKHVPDDFYSTTNYTTMVFYNNEWVTVKEQRMDALIVVDENGAYCKKLRDIKKGDMVVCTDRGVKILSENTTDEEDSFGVSAEEEFITGFFEEEECGSIVEEEKIEEEISKEEEDNVESTAEGLSLPHEEKKKRIKRNTM